MNVTIEATEDDVTVTVDRGDSAEKRTLYYGIPGMLTGAELADVLDACGIPNSYSFIDREICECGRLIYGCATYDGAEEHKDR